MSTLNVSLPVVAGGVGAGARVDGLGADKFIIVTGVTGSVTVEASIDDVDYCPVASFSSVKTDKKVTIVAKYFRLNASGGGAASAEVVGECVLNDAEIMRFAQIPSPPANGNGASLDISEFGNLSTIITGPVSGAVGIEVSADNVNWSPDYKTFVSADCDTKMISAKYIRAVGKGGTGNLYIGSRSCGARVPVNALVFRPDATGADAEGSNVYTTWQDAYNAFTALNGQGTRYIEFDSRFSTHLDGKGNPSCLIPAGTWDFNEEAIWTNPPDVPSSIDLADGCVLTNLHRMEGGRLDVIYDGLTPKSGPFGANTSLTVDGPRTRFFNTVAGAAPMFDGNNMGGFFFIAFTGSNVFGGLGDAAALPAPVIDAFGAFVLLGMGQSWINDNAFADSSVGGVGYFYMRMKCSGSQGGGDGPQDWIFPALPATTIVDFGNEVRPRFGSLFVQGVIPDTASPFTAAINDVVECDTTVTPAPMVVNLPRAFPGRGYTVMVKDSGGGALANNITVTATGGDTIDGAATDVIAVNGAGRIYVSNGLGNWLRMAVG